MYIREITLTNIKCFHRLQVTFPSQPRKAGWYVLLGDNGTGKSTLLQAIALALAGQDSAPLMLPYPEGWVGDQEPTGTCHAVAELEDGPKEVRDLSVLFMINREPGSFPAWGRRFLSRPTVTFHPEKSADLAQFRLTEVRSGTLLAGYGPYRRLLVTDSDRHRFSPPDKLEPFRSLFAPEPLGEAEQWLREIDYLRRSYDPNTAKRDYFEQLLTTVLAVINQMLPPDSPVRVREVGPEGVTYEDMEGQQTFGLSDLSDGYRSVFALVVDLLRRAVLQAHDVIPRLRKLPTGRWAIDVPGVVLIDEVETHLHPRWQRQIGFFLQEAFPRVQFIVSTHSPFVAQAASPDGVFVLRRKNGHSEVSVAGPLHSLKGLRAEQIYTSPAFSLETTRDYQTESWMDEHDDLQARVEAGLPLSAAEHRRLKELSRKLKEVLPPPGQSEGRDEKPGDPA